MNRAMTKTILATALCALALAACSNANDVPAEHSQADRSEGHTSSSSGLPEGHVDAGKQLAEAKGKATGQACVDCHGAEGNAPIDAAYPKIGGQYHDYIAHSLQLYRDGDRSGSPTTDLMASQAKELTDQQIADLAAYFGSRETPRHDLHAQ